MCDCTIIHRILLKKHIYIYIYIRKKNSIPVCYKIQLCKFLPIATIFHVTKIVVFFVEIIQKFSVHKSSSRSGFRRFSQVAWSSVAAGQWLKWSKSLAYLEEDFKPGRDQIGMRLINFSILEGQSISMTLISFSPNVNNFDIQWLINSFLDGFQLTLIYITHLYSAVQYFGAPTSLPLFISQLPFFFFQGYFNCLHDKSNFKNA